MCPVQIVTYVSGRTDDPRPAVSASFRVLGAAPPQPPISIQKVAVTRGLQLPNPIRITGWCSFRGSVGSARNSP